MNIERTLHGGRVHKEWAASYRTAENEIFGRMLFEWMLARIAVPAGASVLDAGCGDARHSLRLARAGLNVTAVDFSDFAAQDARERIEAAGMAASVTVEQADLTQLNFADGKFDAVFCIGVLMHIPNMEAALNHLSRVVRPGGYLVLSESSAYGFDMVLRRVRYSLYPNQKLKIKSADGAVAMWFDAEEGQLLTRTHLVPRLVERLHARGMALVERRAGEFTEFYRLVGPRWAKRAIHGFNRFWFRRIGFAPLATGQVLIFQKA